MLPRRWMPPRRAGRRRRSRSPPRGARRGAAMRADEDRRGGGRRGDGEYEHGGGGGQEEGAGCCCCSCLPPFCGVWGSAKIRRQRRRRRFRFRFRLRLIRLLWFSWPWRKNSGKKKKKTTTTTATKETKGMKKRMLLLLSSSSSSPPPSPSPAKKALAGSISAAAAGSLVLPKVNSFADGGKKQRKSGSKSLPRQTVGGRDAAAPAKETAPPAWQPCPRPAPGELTGVKRAPSRRHGSFRREPGGGGLWTMATTLGVIVFFGRITAVAFLCSCLYGARFVRAQAAGAAAANGKRGGGGSGRFGETAAEERPAAVVEVEVEVCTEEHKKKVVMEGLLDRGGKRFSSRFL